LVVAVNCLYRSDPCCWSSLASAGRAGEEALTTLKATRAGSPGAGWLAFIALVYSWSLWVWWRWRRWCKHSGEPFPRYGPVDFLFMALSTVAILLGWGSELLGRGWASELLR